MPATLAATRVGDPVQQRPHNFFARDVQIDKQDAERAKADADQRTGNGRTTAEPAGSGASAGRGL